MDGWTSRELPHHVSFGKSNLVLVMFAKSWFIEVAVCIYKESIRQYQSINMQTAHTMVELNISNSLTFVESSFFFNLRYYVSNQLVTRKRPFWHNIPLPIAYHSASSVAISIFIGRPTFLHSRVEKKRKKWAYWQPTWKTVNNWKRLHLMQDPIS